MNEQPWKRLIERRSQLGFSQSSLAKALGHSQTCVWNWEWGYTKPRRASLEKLASALEVSPHWLLSQGDVERDQSDAESEADFFSRMKGEIAAYKGCRPDQVRITIEF